ncbi:MAG: hypothetical protein KI786_17885 [Mameliella sp.]|nr:hypothetical protein [Phaeodactylibacter sp.]
MRKQQIMMSGHVPRVHTYTGSPYRTLEEFFLKQRPVEQLFRLNTVQQTTIVGQKGTRLTFPAFALCTTNGQSIEGDVQVRLTEVMMPLEGLLAARSTASEDREVDAISQIQLRIFKDGSPVQLRLPVTVEVPATEEPKPEPALSLFARSNPTIRAVKSNKFFDWRILTDKAHFSTINNKLYYTFLISRCSWYQCGKFHPAKGSKVMVTAKIISNIQSFESQEGLLWLENTNVITRLHPGPRQFSGLNIPANASGYVMVYGMHKRQLYFGVSRLKKASDKLLHVYMEPASETQIIQSVTSL